jgi:rubrerythrin
MNQRTSLDGAGLWVIDQASPPPAAVKSVEEMLAVAHAMEREAAARYAMLADSMRRVDQRDIAELLEGLAAEERGHVDSVERLAHQTLHRAPDSALVHAALPGTFAREDEANAAALLSPYRTLSIAVRHEERAFSFWAYVASQSDNPALRELAEMFARQELIHAAKLRHFHAERDRLRATASDAEDRPSPAEIRAKAAQLGAGFAVFCAAAAKQLRSGSDAVTAALFERSADEMQRTTTALAPTGSISEPDRQAAIRRSQLHGVNGAALLFEAAGMIEDLNYRYLEWLGASATPEARQEFEARAQAATARLARINERLYALEPSLAAIAGRSGNE